MEIFTLVTGVIYLVLEIKQKNFMWVIGVITSLAAMYMFFNQGLYASFALNVYYFVISFWGLYQWRKDAGKLRAAASEQTAVRTGDDAAGSGESSMKTGEPGQSAAQDEMAGETAAKGDVIHLNRMTLKTLLWLFVFLWGGLVALRLALEALDDPMSGLDACVAVMSAMATFMLSRSYIEQWLVWIFADLLSTILCATQGLYWMTALYAAYTLSAVYGYYYWKRKGVYINE